MTIILKPLTCVTCGILIKPIQGNYCSFDGSYCTDRLRERVTAGHTIGATLIA